MKNLYLIIGLILISINSIIGLIFTNYSSFNWLVSDLIILINILFLFLFSNSKISDGFKFSIPFIYVITGLTTFILSINLEKKIENNFILSSILILVSVQIILFIITNSLKTIKK